MNIIVKYFFLILMMTTASLRAVPLDSLLTSTVGKLVSSTASTVTGLLDVVKVPSLPVPIIESDDKIVKVSVPNFLPIIGGLFPANKEGGSTVFGHLPIRDSLLNIRVRRSNENPEASEVTLVPVSGNGRVPILHSQLVPARVILGGSYESGNTGAALTATPRDLATAHTFIQIPIFGGFGLGFNGGFGLNFPIGYGNYY